MTANQSNLEYSHIWNRYTDWEGDPTVYRGVNKFYVWRCRICGEETMDCPEDWEEPVREYEE
jgi:hypothetical protein